MKMIKKIKNILLPFANYSSYVHRIPYWMWEKIMEYAKDKSRYLIKDCNSRNGTFLIENSVEYVVMKDGEGY
jgi:hypothetical protein